MRELVSVILPYRDAQDTLREALASVLAQEGVALEVLAIDDGSRDASTDIVRDLSARDARVVPLRTGGEGLVAALELGRARAKGAWIARMDADDIALPGRLAVQLDALRAMPRAGAIGTRVEPFGEVGEGMRRYVEWQNSLVTPEDHARDLFVEAPLCHPSVMLRREALDEVGGFRDVGWAEDYDLWLRLDAAGWQLAKVPAVLLRWRRRASSATFTDPRYSAEAMRRARAAFLAPRLGGRTVAIWGAGPTGRRLARELERHGVRASFFVDIDPRKIGRTARGAPVLGAGALVPGAHFVVVAVGAPGARELVRAELRRRGFVEGEQFVCAS
ncbi:MAG TPA: glycosyltransferase [Sandaracinaceae bacterium]